MNNRVDLTQGNIAVQLTKVSIPIMMTMFIQMAYNLTDMIWIGSIGSGAVAAVGTAGFFTWVSNAMTFMPKVGLEVTVAQATGKNDQNELKVFMANGLMLSLFISILFSIVIFLMAKPFISFFNLGDNVNNYNPTAAGISYLKIISTGLIFSFLNPCFSAIYNGMGNSKLPFYYNSVGLIINAALDPLLIFGIWFFPKMGVNGAAIATVFAQFAVTLLFVFRLKKDFDYVRKLNEFLKLSKYHLLRILKIGTPPALQSVFFASIAMIIARIIVQWGPIPIAAQKVGTQIESLSWMTAGGFSTALSAFVGQNYGAGEIKRIWKGFVTAMYIMGGIGLFVSLLLVIFPGPLFKIFIREADAVAVGIPYLKILGYSQFFMCLEIATGGAFNGLGKSLTPSIIGVSLNIIRIPAALFLSSFMGLNGVWWAISGSSMLKGIALVTWFTYYYKKRYCHLEHNTLEV
ncbi:MAG: MATE family efflux transporter [Candidatus Cloacimonadales bacterium]|jgi:putative MATE family efflux protein|nr:MATE family efflux transporter [Candidatus Cloacimonadota bacterium]MDD2651009.1 MATE family efflux transporter [Candidatus Cloacimonadota bacterium]MDX9978202.1 MATE family efflux transporter [Candidatus Cloacimonadales bacterium]